MIRSRTAGTVWIRVTGTGAGVVGVTLDGLAAVGGVLAAGAAGDVGIAVVAVVAVVASSRAAGCAGSVAA
jgi:hypothetical protein